MSNGQLLVTEKNTLIGNVHFTISRKHHSRKCKHKFDVSRGLVYEKLRKKENSLESFNRIAYRDPNTLTEYLILENILEKIH